MSDKIEITFKQGNKSMKLVLEEEAINEIEDIREKLGLGSGLEAFIYSIKIFSLGLKEMESGEKQENIKLPNGKEIDIELEIKNTE